MSRRRRTALEVLEEIQDGIHDRRWPVLPTVVGLAKELGTTPHTVIKALRELAEDGPVLKTSATQHQARWILSEANFHDQPNFAHTLAERLAERIRAGEWDDLPHVPELQAVYQTGGQTPAKRGLVFKDEDKGDRGNGAWWARTDDCRRPSMNRCSTISGIRSAPATGTSCREWLNCNGCIR